MYRLALIIVALWMPTAQAEVSVGGGVGGSGSCHMVTMNLVRFWFDVKDHMLPTAQELKRPTDDSFVCVNPYDLRNAREKRLVTSGNMRCFDPVFSRGMGVCCDQQVHSCAMLNPGLFPDIFERPGGKKEKAYEPPKSNWVRPPSDNDQWSSN